ncbi:MAG: hypothetical protein LBI87_10870 [Candidatus Accumulibacter sp.]|nr:hypothetical protein [Accumulibacter sp.]
MAEAFAGSPAGALDSKFGTAGNDTLYGAATSDILQGGAGNDERWRRVA